MARKRSNCEHLPATDQLKLDQNYVCEACIETGDTWVHLRTCQTCGMTLCCDSSPNKHASAHFHATGHPVIISAEPGEKWMWCYKDKLYAKYQ
ncbi:MAG: UBP-type zinc finger domain-containing protein [Bacteroidota bacterium]